MAETDVDVAVLKRTQQMLGKYVKKPVLSEKLLRKPPFRFLHDVFNAVIKETGYFEGLYSADELNFENIKDRDDKMNFLKKMIDVIKFTTENSTLSVRASKIVCGHEPEKTNELLQQIAEVIDKKLNWQNAVQQVNNNSSSPTQAKESQKPTEQPKEAKRKVDKVKETKTKESKGSSKTISPNVTKEEKKPKRTTPTGAKDSQKGVKDVKDKEKGTKEKTSRTTVTKDKANKEMKPETDKKKSSKTKEVKQKTPSPIAIEEATKKKETKTTIKEVEPTIEEPSKQAVSELNEEPSIRNDEKNDEKLEKTETANEVDQPPPEVKSEIPVEPIVQAAPMVDAAETISPIKMMESKRKPSSGKRRTSAGSRRSSANKATREEVTVPPETSLKSLDETLATSSTPTQSSVTTATPTKKNVSSVVGGNAPVQRESTFTRDDPNDIGQEPRPARTTLRPPSARPASARPGAPRKRNRNVEIVLQPNDELKTEAGIHVKLETFGDFGDDDVENLVIIDDGNNDSNFNFGSNAEGNSNAVAAVADVANDDMQQGHLVQQILETQKELVQQTENASDLDKHQERNSADLTVIRQNAQQMDNLRDVIQNLTKAINPFGKLIDFLPEDIDAMQLEMGMWRDAFQQASAELKRERSLTESVTEPMKTQLTQIEANIAEYAELIDASRMKILHNSDKILKMLSE